MTITQELDQLEIITKGEGFTDLTPKIAQWIKRKRVHKGIINLTALHTSCSLIINENADPRVLEDLSCYINALVPEEGFMAIDGQGPKRSYRHSDEGPDDMPAHIRSTLTNTSISLSINQGVLVLGTWQAIYLWEHRILHNSRKIHLHAIGELVS